MTPQDVINEARFIVNDSNSASYRNTDAELLGYVNDGMQAISVLAPNLFEVLSTLNCVAGTAEQGIDFTIGQAVIDVVAVVGGPRLRVIDIATLTAFNPAWPSDTPATPQSWGKYPEDVRRFYLYPAPTAGVSVTLRIVKNPTPLAITDTIKDIPVGLIPALANYVVFRAESKDDENTNSGRAAGHYQAFLATIGGGKQ
jgi:hypothetical protein